MHTYEIFPEDRFIAVRILGDTGYDDILAWIQEVVRDTRYSDRYDGLADYRGATPVMTVEEAERLSDYVRKHALSRGRWATLVNEPVSTVLAMTYAKNIRNVHENEVFSTLKAASAYLGRDLTKYVKDDRLW